MTENLQKPPDHSALLTIVSAPPGAELLAFAIDQGQGIIVYDLNGDGNHASTWARSRPSASVAFTSLAWVSLCRAS
jgi:hypothetical protein